VRPLLPGRRRAGKSGRARIETRTRPEAGSRWEQESVEESALDFSPEELREFLSADLFPDEADPEFKERLREKLWKLVLARYGPNPSSDD
jgi:hypothetical protein